MADETGEPTDGYRLGPPTPPPVVPPAGATASPRAAAAIARAKKRREKAAPAVPAVPTPPAVPAVPAPPAVPAAPTAPATSTDTAEAKPRGLYATPLGEPGNQPWVVAAPEPYSPPTYAAPQTAGASGGAAHAATDAAAAAAASASTPIPNPYAGSAQAPYVRPNRAKQPWRLVSILVVLGVAMVVVAGAVLVSVARNALTSDPYAGGPDPSQPSTLPVNPFTVTDVSGRGDALVPLVLPGGRDSQAVLVLTHDGTETFFVTALDSNRDEQRTLVYDTGSYDGKVLINTDNDRATNLVSVRSDGNWTIKAISTSDLDEWTGGTISAEHDDVFLSTAAAGRATMTYKGEGNFIVWSYGARTDLLANEIDAWSGSEDWPAGPTLISVTARGPWEISVN
ncbi:MAG: hypothetical protein ACOH1T_00360 [Microbacteriaceae bacterium]